MVSLSSFSLLVHRVIIIPPLLQPNNVLRFKYSPRRIAFRLNSSSKMEATLDFMNSDPFSSSSVSKECKVCLNLLIVRGRKFNPYPIFVSMITSVILSKSGSSNSPSCLNCLSERSPSRTNICNMVDISSLSSASNNF